MAEGQIFIGPSASGRLDAATGWLRDRAGDTGALVVAASRGAADDLVRRSLSPGTGRFGIERTTPGRLATWLATSALAAEGRTPLTSLGAEALAARVVESCLREGDGLEYFGPVAGTPGFRRALARTLAELRAQEVDGSELAGLGPAGRDLERLLAGHVGALEHWSLADEATVWRLATSAVESDRSPFRDLPVLLLDVAVTGIRAARCYAALARRAPAFLATVVADDPDTPERLGAVLELERRVDETADAGRRRLDRLRRWVFAEGPGDEPSEEDDSLEFLSAPGEGRECAEIAREIHRLAGNGVPFDRVAVLLRDPDGYLSLLEEAFRRADLPAWFTRGTVRPHPSGRAFLALLACAADNLSASRFAEYLSLGQVPRLDAAGAPRMVEMPWVKPEGDQLVFKTLVTATEAGVVAGEAEGDAEETDADPVIAGTLQTPRRWERLIVDAAVVGGLDRWKRRLAGLKAEFELRLRELDDEEESKRAHLERQIAGVRNLERFALPVIEALAALPEEAGWREWLECLRELAGLTLRRPDEVLAVLAELEPMGDVGPVRLGEVRRALEERLTFLRRESDGDRYGRVFVGTIDEARGRSFDTVFLPGLAEGVFPRRASEDPLLLDDARERLDADLDDQDRRVRRERLLLRIAAGSAGERLVVSYPTLDALQGRARVPSFYALDIARAAEGRLPDADALERRAATAAAPRIGWPAPREPAEAIDAAEFDVAALAPLLTGARPDTEGSARFLLQVNEHLARSLRSRAMRWRPSFSYADGLVSPDDAAMGALQEHRLDARSYSPTALQTYAMCPYKFFLYAVLRLRPREEPAPLEQMDPLTRGSLFHEVQYELFQALREKDWLPVTSESRDRVTELGDRVLDRVASRYAEELAPAIPRVWHDEVEGIRTDLRGWLRAVAEEDSDWVPTFFEFSFGLGEEPGRDPLSQRDEAVVLDGHRLRGSIDLVEQRPEDDSWRVTDHKTGKALRERFVVVGKGEVLQPLLYALAAEYHLGGRVESGRLFYCTRRGEYETRVVDLNAESRDKAARVLGVVDKALADGFLPAVPRERACGWCDFRPICGPYEELRSRRKKRQAIAPLESLRKTP